MPQFEIFIGADLYTGNYDVNQHDLDLFDVEKTDGKSEEVTNVNDTRKLKLIAAEIESKYSEEIEAEREQEYYNRLGFLPEREQGY